MAPGRRSLDENAQLAFMLNLNTNTKSHELFRMTLLRFPNRLSNKFQLRLFITESEHTNITIQIFSLYQENNSNKSKFS